MLLTFPPPIQARRRGHATGQYDVVLLVAIIALASFGVVMVASSSIAVAAGQHIGEFYYLKHHLFYLACGGALAWLATRIELAWIEKLHFLWIALAVFLLLLVFLPGVGMRINGAQRWLRIGPLSFQPVEAVKLALIVYLASYLVRHRQKVETKFFGALRPIAVALLIAALLLAQPDFGSAVLLSTVAIGMIWLGGARMRYLLYMGGPLALGAAGLALSQSYRVQRLLSFINPWKDPFDNGFQLVQALIAIGRGEWFGVGLGGSVQKLFYLPEAHTDFILAVIGEELGLVGILAVMTLFAVLVWRGFVIGMHAMRVGRAFAGHVAFGISLLISLQALVSIGVNFGVLPTKGLTLPLISSGGSSVLMTCLMLGVLLRVSYEVTRAEATRRIATPKSAPAAVEVAS